MKSPIVSNDGARLELAKFECIEVQAAPRFRISRQQNLETTVQQEPIHLVGADPPTDVIRRFYNSNREAAAL